MNPIPFIFICVLCFLKTRSVSVQLAKIAPDIAMVHLSGCKIDYHNLEIGSQIAEGGMAFVYKGLLRGEEVTHH